MSSCIQKEEALSYLSGNMPSLHADRIKTHLLECERCRMFLEQEDARRTKTLDWNSKNQTDPFLTESISPPIASPFSDSTHLSLTIKSLNDGYIVLEALPRGGQAVVYKAIQKSTKRTVVVKMLAHEAHASKHARYRFEREIELVASLQHPCIVTIFDSGITEGKYFYAMEYIEGLPLDDYIRTNRLSQNDIMALFAKITSATAYAHRNGIIHRDLKPGNILVDKDRQPHILDFGLAKVMDSVLDNFEGSVMTSIEGQLLGTLAYMSPEQSAGNTNSIDTRADVYSIGVMLYHALTNVFPYPIYGALLEVLKNIQEVEPEKPSKILSNINSDVEAITLKALSKEPERRYQSANDLHEDIQCFLEDRPVSAKSDSSLYLLKKMLKKHRRTSVVVGLLVVIVLSFSISSIYLYTNERAAVKDLEVARDELSLEMQNLVQYGSSRVFIDFLLSWHQGRIPRAASYITEPKQKRAFDFLNDKTEISERISTYFDQTSEKDQWFSYFVTGELYYKNNNPIQAREYYLNSSQSFQKLSEKEKSNNDDFYRFIKARLYEMTSENLPAHNEDK